MKFTEPKKTKSVNNDDVKEGGDNSGGQSNGGGQRSGK